MTSNNTTTYQNGIKSITLTPVTSYTWDFTNTTIWSSVTNSSADAKYADDGSAATTGTYVSLKGNVVYKSNGVGFGATGSTSDNYAKVTVPKGYKASVTCRVTSNRNISSSFNGTTAVFSGNYTYVTKEYDNTTGNIDLELYLYGSANVTGHNDYPSITNIVLQQYYKMTTNYVYNDGENDNVIQTAVVEYVPLGSEYTLPYDAAIYDTENHYTYNYSSGASTITYVEEDVESTIYYTRTESPSYTVNVTATYGSKSEKIIDGVSYYEGDIVTYYYPAYYLDGTTLYAAPDNDGDSNDDDGLSFGGKVTVTGATDIVLNYVAEEGVCAFYAEGENTGANYSYVQSAGKSSKGGSYCISNKAGLLTDMNLTTGVYSIEVAFGQRGSYSVSPTVITTQDEGSTTKQTLGTVSVSNGGYVKQTFNNILIVEDEEIYIASDNYNAETKSGVSKWALDYIVVRKLYDVTDASKIIGAVDYSTGFMGAHKDMTISEGETIKLTFNNYGNGASNWYNWLVRLSGTTGVDHTFRADNYVLGDDGSTVSTRSIKEDGGDINWSDFLADMQDSEVEMTITYASDGMFSIAATSTGASHAYTHSFAYNDAKSGDITVELGVENAWLEVTSVEKTVSIPVTNGFATYANHTYNLDFTGVEGLVAYTATVNDAKTKVTFTPAKQVPAGTGLLLKGATANVPVIASAGAISSNLMYAPTTAVSGLNYDQDGYYNYILTQPSGKSVGFYRANSNSVALGKAYLRIPQTDGARQFTFIGLDGDSEATGINTVNSEEIKIKSYYNLSGQRVAQPKNGLYIVNGKKVIVNK